jgi:hypothetical protein
LKSLSLPIPVLAALRAFGILDDELLAVVNEVESKDPAFEEGGAAIKRWLTEKIAPHLSMEAAEAFALSVANQIIGKAPGFDPDHGQDA